MTLLAVWLTLVSIGVILLLAYIRAVDDILPGGDEEETR